MRKHLDYLFWNLLLAPENGLNSSGTDLEGDNNTEPNNTTDLNNEVDTQKEKETEKLDYSQFDLKIDEKYDPANLAAKAFSEKAKELGISVSQAKELFGTVDNSIKQSNEDYENAASERCVAALKEQWKDQYEVNNKSVTRGFLHLTENDENLKKELENNGFLNNPLVAQIFSKVGYFFKEEGQEGALTPTFDKNDPYGFGKSK